MMARTAFAALVLIASTAGTTAAVEAAAATWTGAPALTRVVGWSAPAAGAGALDGLVARRAAPDAAISALPRDPDAPAAATNVVLLKVGRVEFPARFPGLCRVEGVVQEVWEGTGYAGGETIVIPVPCQAHASVTPLRSELATPLDAEGLGKAKQGVARIDDSGRLVWQGEPATSARARPFARFVTVWGYRILDGAPVAPRSL